MRAGAEKALVDAILDAEIEADELAERATELGKTLGERLTTLSRALVQAVKDERIDTDQAEDIYRETYLSLALLGFTKVARDVQDHVDGHVEKVVTKAKAMGEAVRKVSAIRNAEKKAREAERRGNTEG